MLRKLYKLIKKILSQHFFNYIAYIAVVVFSLAGSVISVIRYWQYDVFYYDFGIFDMALWRVAHFQAPIIDHFEHAGKWIFADHLSPSMFLYSPLYFFTSHQEIILVAQAVTVGLSGLVLYKIGQLVVKNNYVSFAVMLCYFLFYGTQAAIITDIHEVAFATLFLMLTFWAFLKDKKVLYFVCLFLLLGFKESNFLIGIGIGISVFFIKRSWWKTAVITCFLSAIYGALAIKVIIPYFSGVGYGYSTPFSPNPLLLITSFFDSPAKIHTIFLSLLSFGFLPLLSPAFYFLILQDFFIRFYSPYTQYTTRWGLGLQYNILLAAILAVSSVFSLAKIQRKYTSKKILSVLGLTLILNAVVLYRFILHAPFGLFYNKAFYTHTKELAFIDKAVAHIPKKGTIMAPNNIASHLTHRDVLILREKYPLFYPQYIFVDIRKGQNSNNYYGVSYINKLFAQLSTDPHYSVFYHSQDIYLFKLK